MPLIDVFLFQWVKIMFGLDIPESWHYLMPIMSVAPQGRVYAMLQLIIDFLNVPLTILDEVLQMVLREYTIVVN